MSNIDYTNGIKYNYNTSILDTQNHMGLAKNIDQYTFWNFTELYDFILHNYKQLFLIVSIFIIVFVIEKNKHCPSFSWKIGLGETLLMDENFCSELF